MEANLTRLRKHVEFAEGDVRNARRKLPNAPSMFNALLQLNYARMTLAVGERIHAAGISVHDVYATRAGVGLSVRGMDEYAGLLPLLGELAGMCGKDRLKVDMIL